jgi:hypothetical protein
MEAAVKSKPLPVPGIKLRSFIPLPSQYTDWTMHMWGDTANLLLKVLCWGIDTSYSWFRARFMSGHYRTGVRSSTAEPTRSVISPKPLAHLYHRFVSVLKFWWLTLPIIDMSTTLLWEPDLKDRKWSRTGNYGYVYSKQRCFVTLKSKSYGQDCWLLLRDTRNNLNN